LARTEHGEGLGNFSCFDAGRRDITTSGKVWSYDRCPVALDTSVVDGLVYVAISAASFTAGCGHRKVQWVYDSKSHIWGSTVARRQSLLRHGGWGHHNTSAGKTLKQLAKVDMKSPIYSTPVIANSTIFLATPTHLYA